MRRYEKKRRSETVNELAEVRCDLCGAIAPMPGSHNGDWGTEVALYASEPEKIERTTIETERGHWYSDPDGGYGELACRRVDLCPACLDRMFDWLAEQGAKIEPKKAER